MTYILIEIGDHNLQNFFATFALIERYRSDSLFLLTKNNRLFLNECEKLIKFDYTIKNSKHLGIKKITIKSNHSEPKTSVEGLFNHALLFPQYIADNYFKREKKYDKIYFRGVFTKKRALESIKLCWYVRDFKAIFLLLVHIVILSKMNQSIITSKLHLVFTNRGRDEKHKYIDKEYYEEMSKFKYVFCPVGDFVWTYRFFEAIQVGSLPIVSKSAKIYSMFKYQIPSLENDYDYIDVINTNLENFKDQFCLN